MVIFNSYVNLPEGMLRVFSQGFPLPLHRGAAGARCGGTGRLPRTLAATEGCGRIEPPAADDEWRVALEIHRW